MKDLIHEWEADILGLVEHWQNLHHKLNCNGWNQLFCHGEEDLCLVVAHNVHKNVASVQEGGSGLVIFSPLLVHLDMTFSGKDASGLGQWMMMVLKGDGIQTQIICGYNPCKPSKTKQTLSKTSYAQHR
jgi:hypothetical protein